MAPIGPAKRLRGMTANLNAPDDLEAFCLEQYPRIVGTLTLYCGDTSIAEELAQETLLRVAMKWKDVRRKDSPGAWVHRIAINLANSHFRRRTIEKRVLSHATRLETDSTDTGEFASAVATRQAVAGLPKRLKTALVLRYFLDLSPTETAEVMDCSERTVKRLTKKAIDQLAKEQLVGLERGGNDVARA